MTMQNMRIKGTRICAFCKYWYDPTNAHIAPKAPQINLWQYENSAKAKCMLRNSEMKAIGSCKKYECKLQIF